MRVFKLVCAVTKKSSVITHKKKFGQQKRGSLFEDDDRLKLSKPGRQPSYLCVCVPMHASTPRPNLRIRVREQENSILGIPSLPLRVRLS